MELKPISVKDNTQTLLECKVSPLLNFLFGHHARYSIEGQVLSSLKKLGLKIKKKSAFSFFAFLYTSLMNEKVLDDINPFGYYHNLFGEGFDKDRKDGSTYKSYLFQISEDRFVHIGFDHRGTSLEISIDIKEQEFKELIDWIINICYEQDKETFMEFYYLVTNKGK